MAYSNSCTAAQRRYIKVLEQLNTAIRKTDEEEGD